MRKTLLLFGALGLSVFAKAQDAEMVVNSTTQVTYDSYRDAFQELGTNPSKFIAGDDFIVYSGNLHYYSYWSISRGDTVLYDRQVSEIYVSKGTEETTMGIDFNDSVQVRTDKKDLDYTYYFSSEYADPFKLNGQIYFKARSKGHGYSTCLYTINADGDTAFVADWYPSGAQVVDDVLYFAGSGDRPIITWDGQGEPDTLPNMDGIIDNSSSTFAIFGKYLLLDADLYAADSLKTEAVFYNMETGEHWMYDINKEVGKDGNPSDMTVAGDKVFFIGKDSAGYYGFHVSDGTPEGTYPVDAINDYFAATSSSNLGYDDSYFWNGNLYFTATDTLTESYDRQIYQYNLAGDSIHRLTSYMVDGEYAPTYGGNYTEFDDMLYFSLSIDYVSYLARTDGETVEIVDTVVTSVDEMVVMGGSLYFAGEMPDVNQYNDTSLLGSGTELMVYTPTSTSISRVNEVKELEVYPNPTSGTIQIGGEVSASATYELYDLSGKKVLTGLVGTGSLNLDVNSGVYMLHIQDGSQSMVNKLLVK